MALRSVVSKLIDNVVDRVQWRLAKPKRRDQDTNVLLQWLGQREELRNLHYPAFTVRFIRQWIEQISWKVEHLKPPTETSGYKTLLEQLTIDVPVPAIDLVLEAAQVADGMLQMRDLCSSDADWRGDSGLHFEISSSFGTKGRLLCAAIRFLRPKRCLELGTAYGMSALFMSRMQQQTGGGLLYTVEAVKKTHEIASHMLSKKEVQVQCIRGEVQSVLGELSRKEETFDFVFHDAAHSYEAYVNDFAILEPMLRPGGVFLLDDIRWEDARFLEGEARCYEGWRKIIEHPRVVAAAEINESIGIALLR